MTVLVPFFASTVLSATVVMLLALAGARLARRSRAAVRHVMLAAGLAALLLVPVASIVVPAITVAVPITVPTGDSAPRLRPATARDTTSTTIDIAGVAAAPARTAPFPSWRSLIAGVWLLGATLFVVPVVVGLRQIRRLRRSALPSRRAEALVASLAARDAAIDVLEHELVPGPMTCGVLRPAIVLPVQSHDWTEQDLRRAIVHELEHVRRRDWASQCLSRIVCAMYWFHPLVWIARRQLTLEAERACDDAVLRASVAADCDAGAAAYADQLVVLAERLSAAPGSPALAMANRTDLAARVRAVLDESQRRGPAGARWVAMSSAVAVLLATALSSLHLVAAGQAAAGQAAAADARKFDVISIRPCESEPPTPPGQRSSQGGFPSASPGRFTIECGTVERLIGTAYVRYGEQLTNQAARIGDVEWLKNVPGWLRSEKFTIEAKAEGTPDQSVMLGPMLRNLLEDRFKLKMHRETDERPMYTMTVAKGGLKISPDTCTERDPAVPMTRESLVAGLAAGKPVCGNMNMAGSAGLHKWTIGGATMKSFAGTLSTFMDHHVVDQTGVDGTFNIHLEFSLDEHVPGPDKRYGAPTEFPEPEGHTIFRALEEQLGLKLEPTKGPHGFLVIDHVERPSPDSGPRLLSTRPR